jgi:hypothetical protein
MILKEAATLANKFLSVTPDEDREIQAFISIEPPRGLQDFIHLLNRDGQSRYLLLAKTTLQVRLAEESERTAQKLVTGTDTLIAETKTLVNLTHRLYILTAVLIFLGSFEVIKFILGFFYPAVK